MSILKSQSVEGLEIESLLARVAVAHNYIEKDPSKILGICRDRGVWTIGINDPEYPAILKEIKDAPLVLYGRGIKNFDLPAVAVVGSRKPTPYGIEIANSFVEIWAKAGINIVSGLAFGIDAVAHTAAVTASGRTIAVIASGPDDPTPRTNVGLAEKILKSGGSIISEFPPGYHPEPFAFPMRNRIIAGITPLTVVIEGTTASGSLITAKYANKYHRGVAAIPGSVRSPQSAGPNELIKNGAYSLTRAEDLYTILGINGKIKVAQLSFEEETILSILSQPMDLGSLTDHTGFDVPTVMSLVTKLELSGAIVNIGEQKYQRAV